MFSGVLYELSLVYSFLGLVFILYLVYLVMNVFLGSFLGVLGKMSFMFKVGVVYLTGLVLMLVFMGSGGVKLVLFSGSMWLNNGPVLMLDLSGAMFLMVGFMVSWSIFNFGVRYMWEEPKKKFFLGSLLVFLFFMMLLVTAGNFLFLFLGWEGVGILSFILISWWFSRGEASTSSLQAVFYNRVSDFGLLGFMGFLIGSSSDLSMFSVENEVPVLVFGLFLLGVVSKSSMFIFHPWLPNAMESPTPVSSLLHSSTMVVAGVFLMMRVLEEFNMCYTFLYLLGCVTSLLGSIMAVFQMDMKKIIAYSTTSQLGFMMLCLGLDLKVFGLLYLVSHAFFKAMIFMVSSVFIHSGMNNQDVRVLGFSSMINKFSFMLVVVGSAVMMGFPYLAGFWSKDLILENMMAGVYNRMLLILGVMSVLTTTVYSLRLIFLSLSCYSNVSMKLVGMESYVNLLDYLRLSFSSVVFGKMLFYFNCPTYEGVVLGVVKLLPFLLMFMSLMMSFALLELSSGQCLLVMSYLMYYNPLFHKLWMDFLGKVSSIYYQFDLLFLELMLPRGVSELVLKWRGLMWILLLVWFIYFSLKY